MDQRTAELSADISKLEATFGELTQFMTPSELQAVCDFNPLVQDVPRMAKACWVYERLLDLRTRLDEHRYNIQVSEQLFCQCFD